MCIKTSVLKALQYIVCCNKSIKYFQILDKVLVIGLNIGSKI